MKRIPAFSRGADDLSSQPTQDPMLPTFTKGEPRGKQKTYDAIVESSETKKDLGLHLTPRKDSENWAARTLNTSPREKHTERAEQKYYAPTAPANGEPSTYIGRISKLSLTAKFGNTCRPKVARRRLYRRHKFDRTASRNLLLPK